MRRSISFSILVVALGLLYFPTKLLALETSKVSSSSSVAGMDLFILSVIPYFFILMTIPLYLATIYQSKLSIVSSLSLLFASLVVIGLFPILVEVFV